MFWSFYRVDKGRPRAVDGTGLGLSIVRHMVESHGQRLFVDGERGCGSTFGVALRAAGARLPSIPHAQRGTACPEQQVCSSAPCC
ncbi:MAG: ATP-binding protein [Gemmatimonadota bacterium]